MSCRVGRGASLSTLCPRRHAANGRKCRRHSRSTEKQKCPIITVTYSWRRRQSGANQSLDPNSPVTGKNTGNFSPKGAPPSVNRPGSACRSATSRRAQPALPKIEQEIFGQASESYMGVNREFDRGIRVRSKGESYTIQVSDP